MGVNPVARAVFFDRDGVLNEAIVRDGAPYPPSQVSELKITRGAAVAVEQVHRMGFLAIIVTNQPDVARGTQTLLVAAALGQEVLRAVGADGLYVCYHDDDAQCDCRKPRPGLLFQAASEHNIDLSKSYLVGDRIKDVQAGKAAGCTTIFIDYGYRETPVQTGADLVVGSLESAVCCVVAAEGAVEL